MASGQLESVRNNPRVASAVGAILGGFLSAVAVSSALAFDAQPASRVAGIQLGSTGTAAVFVPVVAAILGFVVGGLQGIVLYAYLNQQAEYFTPLRDVFRTAVLRSALSNGVLACVAAILLLSAPAEWLYVGVITLFIGFATVVLVAMLAWSHAADWPTRPAIIEKRERQRTPFAEGEPPVLDVREPDAREQFRTRPREQSAPHAPDAPRSPRKPNASNAQRKPRVRPKANVGGGRDAKPADYWLRD